ncbi:MAG: DMT family transporter [Acidobacteria bacterium]|nr:MAG: DMT family transporter [Acidobacteriota bacterium]REK03997.1 MAG: DMT family transporter [Acidobacteriota bacterium]REK15159.1 MAG: DMT family transporter [Acidobacteriota bacterium]REK46249.1 MAG: DMT family transporter [Acidobacteriota bacterium]
MRSLISNYFFILLAVTVGMAGTAQAAINNKLNEFIVSPMVVALVSFIVGGLALLIYIVVSADSLSSIWTAKNVPWYAWTGGVLGAYFVACTVILVPRLGVALTFSLIIAGQMVLTLIIDHYAMFGVPERPVTLARMGGVAAIILGVVLIRKF